MKVGRLYVYWGSSPAGHRVFRVEWLLKPRGRWDRPCHYVEVTLR